jgi:hypothetical protein
MGQPSPISSQDSQYPFSQSFHYWLGFGFVDFIHGLLLEAPRVEGKHQQTKKNTLIYCAHAHILVSYVVQVRVIMHILTSKKPNLIIQKSKDKNCYSLK